jgi:simple sugar transport system permease protein
MSATDLAVRTGFGAPRARQRSARSRLWLYALGLFVLMAMVRVITGTHDITSSGTVNQALILAVPIGLAGLGGLWSERAGVVNIGLEGMLILGTWFGAWAGYQWGPWAGVLAAVIGGALGGFLHAVATVTFGVDHIVSGVAINILALGLTRYLSALLFVGKPGGGVTQSPRIPNMGTFSVPGLGDPLATLERKHWFLVSDLAGIVRGCTVEMSWLTLIAIVLVPLSFWMLWKTAFGLRLRSCGENPIAAESLGIAVYRMKYAAVVISGALAGLGGGFLSIVAANIYREGQTGGRGFIGLAAMIFGNWRPGGLAAGAGLFGYTDALQLRGGGVRVHALLLLVALILLIVAVINLRRRRVVPGAIALVTSGLVLLWYLASKEVPGEFTTFAPHLTTLLVLSLASQRLRMPAADGLPYRKGGAH